MRLLTALQVLQVVLCPSVHCSTPCWLVQYCQRADWRAGCASPRVARVAREARPSVNPAAHGRRGSCSTGCGHRCGKKRPPSALLSPAFYDNFRFIICASAAERNWSVYGAAIKTTARGQMGHTVADKRVYCHEALHLKGKLQTAGYKQAVEKWDTDSDSDSSDEGDLKM